MSLLQCFDEHLVLISFGRAWDYFWGYISNKSYLLVLRFIKVIRTSWLKKPPNIIGNCGKGLSFWSLSFWTLECTQVLMWCLLLSQAASVLSFLTPVPEPLFLPLAAGAWGLAAALPKGISLCVFLTQGKGWRVCAGGRAWTLGGPVLPLPSTWLACVPCGPASPSGAHPALEHLALFAHVCGCCRGDSLALPGSWSDGELPTPSPHLPQAAGCIYSGQRTSLFHTSVGGPFTSRAMGELFIPLGPSLLPWKRVSWHYHSGPED